MVIKTLAVLYSSCSKMCISACEQTDRGGCYCGSSNLQKHIYFGGRLIQRFLDWDGHSIQ